MYNLFPAALAAPVVTILKDIIPLLGIVLIRIGLYMASWLQRSHSGIFFNPQQSFQDEDSHLGLRFQKQD